jgi:hypothetical protein
VDILAAIARDVDREMEGAHEKASPVARSDAKGEQNAGLPDHYECNMHQQHGASAAGEENLKYCIKNVYLQNH